MKNLILGTVLLLSTSAFANGPDETFTRTNLSYWMAGAEDVVIGRGVKEQCDAADQALANQTASQAALAACNSSPSGYRCFVSSAVITFNGPLSDEIKARYGLQENQFTLNTWHGCESTATVFGFRSN